MRTGVIGLGAMGAHMARNFAKHGHLVGIWNRTRSVADELGSELDVPVAESATMLAGTCELIVTCVSRDNDVLQVMEMLARGISRDSVVVDTSTVSAHTANQAAEVLAVRGAKFLDAPVSGGVEGARNGTLAVMVGGDAAVLERVQPTLEAIARRIVHMGATGAGQATKAVNQIMCAGINQGVTEALAFGAAMGLDMDKAIDVVASGAAGNWFLDHRGKTMVRDSFATGFKLALHHKDLKICRAMAASSDCPALPVLEQTIKDYETLMREGHGDDDISALYRLRRLPEK